MEGVRKLGWAVKSRSTEGYVIHMAYYRHDTPEQAIQAYVEQTGKTWAESVSEGAVLVQQEIVEFKKPTSGQ